jgi:hypothetical protein
LGLSAVIVDVEFLSQGVIDDPFPSYEAVRAPGRVVRNDLLGVWMVPGYRDIPRRAPQRQALLEHALRR